MDLDHEDLLSLAIESVEKEAILPSVKSNTKCSNTHDLVKSKDTEGSLSVLENQKKLFEEDEENILAEVLESIENEKTGKKKRNSLIGVDLRFEDIAPENLLKEIDKVVNSVVHSGDTDSSDDEDNKYFEEARYDSYGKSIKKALQGAQKVVGPSSAVINRESSWKAKPSNQTKPTQSVFTVPETVGSNKTFYSTFDPVFGIRIVNPLVSSKTIKEKMAGRTPISFMKLKAHVTHGDLKTDWVVAAVLVRKFPPRVSQKGSNYSNWLLSDLKGNLKTVLLFLFGRAHDELWKTPSGTVLAILNPSVLNDKKTSDYEAKLSINSGDQVMIWGRSKDLGQCKFRKKNGENCGSFVNVAECEFCVHHVKQEYKKYNSRSELQFSGNAQVNLRNKVLGKNEVFYGGKSFTALSVGKKAHNPKDKERLKGLGMPQGPVRTTEEKVQIPDLQRSNKMFNLLPSGNALLPSKSNVSDSARLSTLTSSVKNESTVPAAKGKRPIEVKPNQDKTPLCEKKPLLTNPGNEISFDLEISNEKLTPVPVTKMTQKENCKTKTSSASKNKLQKRFNSLLAISSDSDLGKKPSLASPTPRDSVKGQSVNHASTKSAQKLSTQFVSNTNTPKEIKISKETNLPRVTTDSNKRLPNDSVEPDNTQPELLNRSPLLISKGNAPQGLAQINYRSTPSPKLPPNSGMSRAKLKALQFVKEKGPICKDNPSGSDPKKCLKRPLSPTLETENENKKPVLSERFLELMNQKSIHEDLVEMREMEQELEYFDKLEKKDRLEEKMLNTFKVDCKAVKCLKCNYTWFSVSEACKAEGHPTKVIDAIKRFFKCGKCSNRTVSLTIIPLIPCRKCFSTNWVRAPMIREKIAKSDNLSIRGGEQKFVNSVITNASLDLLVPD